nr:MAG TPA: hypothetical protein [Herelleviridae sp.]
MIHNFWRGCFGFVSKWESPSRFSIICYYNNRY